MPTLLRTLLPSLVTRHPLRMPQTDFRRSSARIVRSHSAVACGRARESGLDGVSPVCASMYCSPDPAALHIAPAARLREFCLYDSCARRSDQKTFSNWTLCGHPRPGIDRPPPAKGFFLAMAFPCRLRHRCFRLCERFQKDFPHKTP